MNPDGPQTDEEWRQFEERDRRSRINHPFESAVLWLSIWFIVVLAVVECRAA